MTMKKNFFYSMMALFVVLFATACSQEEIISNNGTDGGKVVLSVNVSGATPDTRAVADVDGYVMRCIMEAVDKDGAVINGTRMVAPVSGGKATFEFEKHADAAQYLFWADYVEGTDYTATKTAIYNADALTAIGYRLNKSNTLFNNAAADAFCAAVVAGDLGSNITLKRPFTRLAIKKNDIADWGNLTNIVPSINSGVGYNVATGEATSAVTMSLNTGETLTALADGENAFFCYVFQSASIAKPSTIKFNDGTTENQKTLNITANQMQKLDSNTSVNLKPSEEPGDDKIKVEIEIDNSFNEGGESGKPDEPETPVTPGTVAVGSYINAKGKVVTDVNSAVAVVFAMADGKTDNSTYPDSKKAKAYAVSLKMSTTGRLLMGDYSGLNLTATDDANNAYAGYAFSSTIKTAFDNFTGDKTTLKLFNGFFSTSLEKPAEGSNMSEWYIPSIAQITEYAALSDATLTANLKAAYTGNFYLVSSTVTADGVQGAIYNVTDGTLGKGSLVRDTSSGHIFPVLTIFE
ncbi:hypothetical protein CE91St12_16390 [Bacteroides uniformis]|uniref:Fimbrillin family protein n=2 Tax=Bacteroides uniformis TaxID=820 RepID=A0AA37JWI6_BACUN|nr:hypothetical protein CE91St12_16390 [Bacteroides uniformis]GKH36768.1 hypothetical protein CE91St13_16390 [Bacteroides uniformis]